VKETMNRSETIDLRTSAADAVTNRLRQELLDGSIPAGSRIMPKEIAQRFTLSIVPVREAIRRLEAEGLVVTSPQRATFAADIGVEDLSGVYDLRRVVEAEFAERATKVATEADIQRCKAALKDLITAKPYSPAFFEAHRNFHWLLLAPAASPIIRTVLERLWQSVDRYINLGVRTLDDYSTPSYIASFKSEHTRIGLAFEKRDGGRLRRLLVDHFTRTETAMRKMLSKIGPDEEGLK
jgi:DNA-binding GntR family transcriptional regulator